MAGMQVQKSSGNRRGLILLVAALAALLLLVFWFRQRSQPETLVRGAGNGKIVGENAYWGDFRDPNQLLDPSIKAQSIHGGAERTLALEDPGHEFYSVSLFSIADGELYYAVQPRTHHNPIGGGGGGSGPGNFLGSFLLAPNESSKPEIAGQKRVLQRVRPIVPKDTTFRQVSLQGGTPRDQVTLRGENYCLVGSHVFWIQPHPEERVEFSRGQTPRTSTYWIEGTAHSDLMLTSLTDGATRCILSGVPRSTALQAGEAGVIFELPAPFPVNPTLFYARASDGSVRSLGILTTNQYPSYSLELGGRLYWKVSGKETFNFPHDDLMSANLDGTDRRELLSEMEGQQLDQLSLGAYHGNLYCAFDQRTSDYKGRPKRFLCRLHPERTNPIEILRKLPVGYSSYEFDGGYLYFSWGEQTRSLWAALTDPDAPAHSTGGSSRVPLDR